MTNKQTDAIEAADAPMSMKEQCAEIALTKHGGDGGWVSGDYNHGMRDAGVRIANQIRALSDEPSERDLLEGKYHLGDRLTKVSGASWTGHVVGFYRSTLTEIGYAIESENEPGSVQIYPEKALTKITSHLEKGKADGYTT